MGHCWPSHKAWALSLAEALCLESAQHQGQLLGGLVGLYGACGTEGAVEEGLSTRKAHQAVPLRVKVTVCFGCCRVRTVFSVPPHKY
jgi:hypothetical protein